MTEKFAHQLREFIDDRDVDQVLRCLDGLKLHFSSNAEANFSRYWLAFELIAVFGPVKLSLDQLKRLKEHVQFLLETVGGKHDELPPFPGLDLQGVNILHALAVFTAEDPLKAEMFFSALKRAGFVTKTLLRARCAPNESLPLHLAAEVGNVQTARDIQKIDTQQLILTNGAGLTAGDIAEAAGHTALASGLRVNEKSERQKRQVATAINALSTENPEPTVAPPPGGSAVSDMLDMLRGFQSAQLVRGSPGDEQEMEKHAELSRLKILIRNICESAPGGVFMSDAYFKFLVRLGIRTRADVAKLFADPYMSLKVPSWMRMALHDSISSSL